MAITKLPIGTYYLAELNEYRVYYLELNCLTIELRRIHRTVLCRRESTERCWFSTTRVNENLKIQKYKKTYSERTFIARHKRIQSDRNLSWEMKDIKIRHILKAETLNIKM